MKIINRIGKRENQLSNDRIKEVKERIYKKMLSWTEDKEEPQEKKQDQKPAKI